MVLDFIPCDVDVFSGIYEDYKNIKKLNNNEYNKLFFKLLDVRFCKYILPRGKNKGKLCMKKFRCEGLYCSEHTYLNTKCNLSTCENKRRKGSKLCTKHYKYKTIIENEIIENEIINFKEEDIESTKIDNFICYYPNINIYKIKIGNDFLFPKNYFSHESINKKYNKNYHVIKYKRFSLINLLYNVYNNFKNKINNFINKYNINMNFLYNFLLFLKEYDFSIINKKEKQKRKILIEDFNENAKKGDNYNYPLLDYNLKYKIDINDIRDKYNKYGYICKTDENKQLIIYNLHGFDVTYKYFRLRIKRYKKNKKKNDKRKLKLLYNDANKDESLEITKEYFYEILGKPNKCYECNNDKNIIKLYYLHFNNIYESYNCSFCSLSDEFIEAFGIEIIGNIDEFIKNKNIIYK